jgi:tetratricopeptide (TPR) repeat protein
MGGCMGESRISGLGGHTLWRTLAVVAMTALACHAAQAQPRERPFNARRDCYLDLTRAPDPDARDLASQRQRLTDIAANCSTPAERPGIAYAYFHAAQANRILGENAPAERARLVAAIEQLQAARVLARNDDRLRDLAQLELVRVHRLLGPGAYDVALELLREMERGRGSMGIERAMRYERAMIYIAKEGPTPQDDETLQSAHQDLRIFLDPDPRPARPNLYVLYRGPEALARLSQRLGNEALQRQPTADNRALALSYFTDAEAAWAELSRIGGAASQDHTARMFIDMGLLRLQMASLQGGGSRADMWCAPSSSSHLDAARRSFESALSREERSIDANWGMGCTLAALGRPSEALPHLQRAASFLASDTSGLRPASDYHLALADVLVRLGQYSGAQSAFAAALGRETDNARKASIHMRIAAIYGSPGPSQNTTAALSALNEAIRLRPDAEAYLMRAQLRAFSSFDDGGISIRPGASRAEIDAARIDLREALKNAGDHHAPANYMLSRLEQHAGNGAAAVEAATSALSGDGRNPIYREQACLTRIRFGPPRRETGDAPCAAAGRESPEAHLYEGMFWLRIAYGSTGGNRQSNFARALRAFDAGRDLLAGSTGGSVEGVPERNLIEYGRRYSLHCSGLEAANPALPGDTESEAARSFFRDRYELRQCWRQGR